MISIELLKDPQRAGLKRLPAGVDVAALGTAAGLKGFAADLSGATTLDGAYAVLAGAMAFPDWFGNNLDALMDCLTDMSWAEAPGYLLLLTGTAPLANADPAGFADLLEVLDAACEPWRGDNIPFWVLADVTALQDA